MTLENITDASYGEDVLKSELPVVIDFWAPWCGPCKQITPILEEIATELEGKVKIVKLNIDENPKIAAQMGIRGIPALALVKGGKIQSMSVGAKPKSALNSWILPQI